MPDIDIDLRPDFKPEMVFPQWTRASIHKGLTLTPHPCGVYPQAMAVDPISNLAAIPYDEAEKLDYMKIDFLHLHVYRHFNSRDEIIELIDIEPNWKLLLVPSVVERLFQLSKHIDILQQLRPQSIEDLSDVLALIRPGKKSILNMYLQNKSLAKRLLYARKAGDEYAFKKSHSVAYALVVVLQLHLAEAGVEL